jgi:putative CocE/NonD family hydrolase
MPSHWRHAPNLVLLASVLLVGGCQAIASYFVLPRQGIRPAEYAVHVERNVTMTTSDGVRLLAEVYRPVDAPSTPTILVRLPYSKSLKSDTSTAVVGRFWASRGYSVVIQASRGRHGSGGEFYPLRDERRDGIEALHWLARQLWYDGRLGMWGGSAFGYTQWAVADQRDPGPSAFAIQIASSHFYDMFYPGGAFSLESALYWAVRSRGTGDAQPARHTLDRGEKGFPLIAADDRAVGDIGFFNDWVNHPQNDAYWEAIDGVERARDIQAPVLLMAGWSDPFLPGQLRDFETIRAKADPRVAAESRLIIGPWTHADAIRFPDGSRADDYRPASLASSIPWFDHLLLGRPADSSLIAPVQIFVMGENVWRDEKEWPLARAVPTKYYLRSAGNANSSIGDGKLSLDPPDDEEPADSYVYDPRDPVPTRGGAMLGPAAGMREQNDIEARKDVLVYSTEPLAFGVEVTGPLTVTLHVDTTAANTDFTAKLVDVYPDGKAHNVSDGVLRRSYQHAAEQGAAPQVISIELWPTSMLFRPGHRIRVEISSSNFPRYDRNTNTGSNPATDISPKVATQVVHHSRAHPSSILLPVVPR